MVDVSVAEMIRDWTEKGRKFLENHPDAVHRVSKERFVVASETEVGVLYLVDLAA